MSFKKAVRTQKKLRMSLEGPSGSGKTYTALQVAKGLGDRIAVIDTERGSASLYADIVPFDVIELDYFSVDNYVKAIGEAVEAGYDVLVIDSLSHAWAGLGGVLDAVNNIKGNVFTDGWGKVGTPQQNRLMDAILKAPLHVIATMRVKTDYEVEKDEKGRSVPKRVGLAPVQRDNTSYEFDIVGSLNIENTLTIEKSRMVDLAGRIVPKPDRKLGRHILAWLNSGEAPTAKINPDDAPVFRRILDEEIARINTWKAVDAADKSEKRTALAPQRGAIIDSYKAVKGVATSIDLQTIVMQNPATSSMNAQQILGAVYAIAQACDSALPGPSQARLPAPTPVTPAAPAPTIAEPPASPTPVPAPTAPASTTPPAMPPATRAPGQLKAWLNVEARKYERRQASSQQRGQVAAALEQFLGDEITRHAVQAYLTGFSSMKDMPDMFTLALHFWLKPTYSKGRYECAPAAVEELKAVAKLAGAPADQPGLPLDGAGTGADDDKDIPF